ncbi:MAG: FAD-dependent pyridine nucleotide-disulfide oxidoreductase [Fusobacteria bacterium]|nr:MAG: FAD-dependent pyridine nucleotide-disulfide oxidoreductase [Fusobacteriota bacterium]KAF0228493.1 MAG: FAD-dependent pyridine nucleotide-disulfide [Fusobacteriota bacterium]
MWDIVIIGAGPAGLGAAVEASKVGAKVLLVDENKLPGGQLFKQIHKFFGSKEHYAGLRGYQIGEKLIGQALANGVSYKGETICQGFTDEGDIILNKVGKIEFIKSKAIILATGGIEKGLPFKNWTLPGVMTAGCAQTFANVHGIKVGQEILVIGSGNVGLITAYQLIQAGMKIKGIVEYQEKITGYEVHLNKIRKLGIPLYTNHTIIEATGDDHVKAARIIDLVSNEEKIIDCDTILLAVGLRTNSRLAINLGCKTIYNENFGGLIPLHDERMCTSVKNIFVAGDITAIEEANTALDEGRIAGLAAAQNLGYKVEDKEIKLINQRLVELRSGFFGQKRKDFKQEIIRRHHHEA